MPDQPSRMEVNAAIRALISGQNEMEAAKTLIHFGRLLPRRRSVSAEAEDDRQQEVRGGLGIQKEQVGYYKLWNNGKGELEFHNFWRSDTAGDELSGPVHYLLRYDENTLEPLCFGDIAERVLFSFGGISFVSRYLRMLAFSEDEKKLFGLVLRVKLW